MYDQFQGELEFLTPTNTVMSRDQLCKHVDHARYFRLHQKKNRLPERTIKSCDHVHSKLWASNVWFSEHQWTQDVIDVVEIGWYTWMNPAIALPTQVEEAIRNDIIRTVGISASHIPQFRCGFTNVKMKYNNRQMLAKQWESNAIPATVTSWYSS
jgi:hypothetical protein